MLPSPGSRCAVGLGARSWSRTAEVEPGRDIFSCTLPLCWHAPGSSLVEPEPHGARSCTDGAESLQSRQQFKPIPHRATRDLKAFGSHQGQETASPWARRPTPCVAQLVFLWPQARGRRARGWTCGMPKVRECHVQEEKPDRPPRGAPSCAEDPFTAPGSHCCRAGSSSHRWPCAWGGEPASERGSAWPGLCKHRPSRSQRWLCSEDLAVPPCLGRPRCFQPRSRAPKPFWEEDAERGEAPAPASVSRPPAPRRRRDPCPAPGAPEPRTRPRPGAAGGTCHALGLKQSPPWQCMGAGGGFPGRRSPRSLPCSWRQAASSPGASAAVAHRSSRVSRGWGGMPRPQPRRATSRPRLPGAEPRPPSLQKGTRFPVQTAQLFG